MDKQTFINRWTIPFAHVEKELREEWTNQLKEDVDELLKASQPVEALVSNANGGNKIRWFMELALKMREKGYCDASIYSIDVDAWDEYRVDDEYTPEQAITEDESNA